MIFPFISVRRGLTYDVAREVTEPFIIWILEGFTEAVTNSRDCFSWALAGLRASHEGVLPVAGADPEGLYRISDFP